MNLENIVYGLRERVAKIEGVLEQMNERINHLSDDVKRLSDDVKRLYNLIIIMWLTIILGLAGMYATLIILLKNE